MIRKTLLVLFGLFVFLGVTTVVSALAGDVYDNRKGDGSPAVANSGDTPCSTESNDKKATGGASSICVENLPASANNIVWRCDTDPVRGSATTLRGGITPGNERCISLTKGRETCDVVYVCAIGAGSAIYIVHFLK